MLFFDEKSKISVKTPKNELRRFSPVAICTKFVDIFGKNSRLGTWRSQKSDSLWPPLGTDWFPKKNT